MSRDDAAGRCMMLGFRGTTLDPDTGTALRRIAPGGIILFKRNLESPEQLGRLVSDLARLLPGTLLLALDQEGGRVSRLEPWIGPTPAAAAVARSGEETARRFGAATGRGLSALGFNVDFAPVVDLCPPGFDNGIGDRSFGSDPHAVARLAGAFLDGLQEEGIAGCLKHFPGLGAARVDSHYLRPRVERTSEELEAEELLPYRVLCPRSALVMVSHGHYPAFDPDTDIPATLSRRVILDGLRGRLAFPGLVASDDLEMGAVSVLDENGSAAVQAMAAGCDLLLYCSDLERAARAKEALVRAAASDTGFAARLERASEMVVRTGTRWPRAAPDLASWASARVAIQEASELT